ncbi:hypothetical protein [Rahnella sp. R3(2024)]|uniref:hypothetical protein n=1 Tax=unclassified Rahnella TaxID=2635087 RepID=UPI0036EB6644
MIFIDCPAKNKKQCVALSQIFAKQARPQRGRKYLFKKIHNAPKSESKTSGFKASCLNI